MVQPLNVSGSTFAKRFRYRSQQTVRSAWYGAQMAFLNRRMGGFSRPGEPKFQPKNPDGSPENVRKAYMDAFIQDFQNVQDGLYPMPEDTRFRDLPGAVRSAYNMLRDADEVNRRRVDRNGTEVRAESDPDKYPTYYRQNFHYQSGGWFTEESARLYDTQVEVLFAGAGAAMRRAALAEVSKEVRSRGAADTRYTDIACGTGGFLVDVMRTYPRLKASGVDLSTAYCDHARKQLEVWPRVEIFEGAVENLPFDDGEMDVATCVYLFHELPPRVRPMAAAEIHRILSPGGLFVFADSIQPGDNPDLDQRLEYFPEGFHEPYYKSYGETDLNKLFEDAGFEVESVNLSFLTKIMRLRKRG